MVLGKRRRVFVGSMRAGRRCGCFPARRTQEQRMQIPGVAIIPRCAECEACWLPADEERWRAYLTDDEPPELAFYLPGVR
jgi:hypothetical protein